MGARELWELEEEFDSHILYIESRNKIYLMKNGKKFDLTIDIDTIKC